VSSRRPEPLASHGKVAAAAVTAASLNLSSSTTKSSTEKLYPRREKSVAIPSAARRHETAEPRLKAIGTVHTPGFGSQATERCPPPPARSHRTRASEGSLGTHRDDTSVVPPHKGPLHHESARMCPIRSASIVEQRGETSRRPVKRRPKAVNPKRGREASNLCLILRHMRMLTLTRGCQCWADWWRARCRRAGPGGRRAGRWSICHAGQPLAYNRRRAVGGRREGGRR